MHPEGNRLIVKVPLPEDLSVPFQQLGSGRWRNKDNLVMNDPLGSIYKSVGGDEPYYHLVDEFYKGVETDPVLRPLYPKDLTESKRNLTLFLIQRTGGPGTYSAERGHPRMRARHLPFPIGVIERNAWMVHMTAALDNVPEFASFWQALHDFFSEFATFMINKDD